MQSVASRVKSCSHNEQQFQGISKTYVESFGLSDVFGSSTTHNTCLCNVASHDDCVGKTRRKSVSSVGSCDVSFLNCIGKPRKKSV